MFSNAPAMRQQGSPLLRSTHPSAATVEASKTGSMGANRPMRVQFAHRDSLDKHDHRPVVLDDDDDDLEAGKCRKVHERTALLCNSHGDRYWMEDEDDMKLDVKGVMSVLASVLVIVGVLFLATVVSNGEYRSLPIPRPPHHSLHPAAASPPVPSDQPRNRPYLIRAKRGAVASEHVDCSNVGVDILKEGGNAVDAAIAANLCVGTLNVFSSGIGGGGFAIIRIPPSHPLHSRSTSAGNSDTATPGPSEAFTIDFRETAPSLSSKTMYPPGTDKSRFGGLAVGVPGELRGLWDIHSRWGKLKWRRLVEPSITMARSWKVRTELSRRLKRFGAFILDDPDWATTFAPNGKFLEEGDVLRRPAFARTLESIADGVEPFYTGAIGDSILRKIASKGGIMTAEDLASYKPIIMPALEGSYRGRKIYTTRAPSSGPALLHILNILETFDLVGEGRTGKNVHRLTEALKFGFAGRTRIADPQFMVDTREIAKLATKEFGRVIAANLTDDITHDPDYYHPKYDVKEDHGTTHTSVVDSDGLVVGITSSINLVFGSRVLDPHTGIILNDEMDDFSVPGTPNAFGLWPSPYNYPEPGKRPLSSIAPIIMEKPNGYFHLVAGGSGGSRIFGSIVQTILNVDWGMDVSAAVEQARVHDQLFPRNVSVETTINDEEVLALEAAGHRIDFIDIRTGVAEVQAIHAAEEGLLHAASDSRKNGVAAGY